MKKNICTLLLILNVAGFLYLAFTLNPWAIVAFITAVGFATLEAHYEGETEWNLSES